MEFLLLSRRRYSVRNVPSSEERGETDVFAGYPPPGSIPGTYLYMAQDLLTFAAFSAYVDICESFIYPFDYNSIIDILIRTKGICPCNVEVPCA